MSEMEKGVNLSPTEVASHDLSSGVSGSIDAVDDKILYRRIDWHIMPLMFFCYLLQFLDKVLINYANIMGMTTSLNMEGQDFSWMATAFFIAYAVAELPQGYLLQKFPVSKVLGANILLWGVVLCGSSGAQNYAGMVALRALLGAFEAIITPALVLVTSQWYTKKQACPRTGIWYCGLGAGQILGGLISFAAQHGSKTSAFEGWRIMFLCVGVFNMMVAIAVLVLLPSSVDSAKFLKDVEKVHVHERLALDQAGNGRHIFKRTAILETLLDPGTHLLLLITIMVVIPSGVITTFSATLIRGLGFDPKVSALLNMPSGVISIFATLTSTFAIQLNVQRWLSLILLFIPTIIGAGLMSFENSQAGALAGVYLINFCVAPLAIIYAWAGSNTQSYTRKVSVNVIIQIGFSAANIIGPQTFRAHEAPRYISAKATILAVNGSAVLLTVFLRLLYGYRNRESTKMREARLRALSRGEIRMQDLVEEEDLSDLTNPAFVYVY